MRQTLKRPADGVPGTQPSLQRCARGALVVARDEGNYIMAVALRHHGGTSGGRTVVQAKRDHLPGRGLAQATILLVEDEVIVRMTLADQLRSAGYIVLEASNAGEALDLLHSNGHAVQLLLSDIRMPGRMNGVELARAIRAQHPEIKIMLASGESFSASHWGDTDGFFPKPYNAGRLIEHIKMLLS